MNVPAPLLAVSAMVSVQLGAALSTHLFSALTPAGSAWLRLAMAGAILLVTTRPPIRRLPRSALRGALLLGATTGVLMLMYIEAIARIPLGTASAIEFLGPLTVAAARSRRPAALIWPVAALAGVVALTLPWAGHLNVTGVGFALGAAAGWGGYLLLTQRVGAQIEGLQGLAISLTAAAVVTAPFGARAAIHGLTPSIAAAGLGLAVLVPLLPFALELLAMRRMPLAAFGTLMALEPGIATLLGLALLTQVPDVLQIFGMAFVILAGIGAQRAHRPAARYAGTGFDELDTFTVLEDDLPVTRMWRPGASR